MNMQKDTTVWLRNLYDFSLVEDQRGIKCLVFLLNPNGYNRIYQGWIVGKVELKFYFWCNKWLLRGGRLFRMKSMLESISMYWVSLSYIPLGTLKNIRRLCYNFLWKGDVDGHSYHWET